MQILTEKRTNPTPSKLVNSRDSTIVVIRLQFFKVYTFTGLGGTWELTAAVLVGAAVAAVFVAALVAAAAAAAS